MVIAAALAALSAAGCGASGGQSFDAAGYPFSFDYPAGWTLTRQGPGGAGGAAPRAVSVALEQPFDQVTLTQYPMKKKLPSGARGYQAEVDRIVARQSRRAGGSAGSGKTVSYGGLPGYQYEVSYPAGKLQIKSRLTFLFRGAREFQVNCQSSEENRSRLLAGCEQILDSLKFR